MREFPASEQLAGELPALWTGTVKIITGSEISLWVANAKTSAVTKIPDSAAVAVLGDPDGKGFAQARYGGKTGPADLQYVIPPEGKTPALSAYRARVINVSISLNLRRNFGDRWGRDCLRPVDCAVCKCAAGYISIPLIRNSTIRGIRNDL